MGPLSSIRSYNQGRIILLFDRKVDMELKQFELNAQQKAELLAQDGAGTDQPPTLKGYD